MLQPATDRASAALLMSSGLHLDQAHRSLGRDYPFKLKIRRSFFFADGRASNFPDRAWPKPDRFCSAVKQPATTTACLPRPKVCAANGDVYDEAARNMANRAGILQHV